MKIQISLKVVERDIFPIRPVRAVGEADFGARKAIGTGSITGVIDNQVNLRLLLM
jgi:hypothetical protein